MWWMLVAAAAATFAIYWLIVRPHRYWVDRGVKQGTSKPIFGDSWGITFKTQSFADLVETVYNAVPNVRYSGFYQFSVPTLVLKDPELIKQITVKDFDHFTDHRVFVPEDVDPLWGRNLFALTGKRWRDMRVTMSPSFTSSKMKFMFSLISQSGEQFVNHFLKKQDDVITIEMRDTFTRFTNDVIANAVFGIQCDSLSDRTNDFYMMGKEATDFSGFWKGIKFFGYFFVPRVCKLLGFTLFSSKVSKFFRQIVKSNIESREKHGIVRPDMMHLLLQARKLGFKHEDSQPIQDTGFATVEESNMATNSEDIKHEITDDDITSQALGFFFAGFDSVASLMCFAAYELGANPDIQDRLMEEIDETLDECKGKLTYEALLDMKYMDMVISETLRKWPNAVAVDRICTKPYTIEPKYPDERPVHLKYNDVVWLPIYGLHRDPRHYPDPERFDPERFSDENKRGIMPYTYLPFGSGPRNCVGSRFALLETKTLIFYILSEFQVVPIEKTQIPVVVCKQQFTLTAAGGFWFGLKRRVKE